MPQVQNIPLVASGGLMTVIELIAKLSDKFSANDEVLFFHNGETLPINSVLEGTGAYSDKTEAAVLDPRSKDEINAGFAKALEEGRVKYCKED